jgi:hypothetical protein
LGNLIGLQVGNGGKFTTFFLDCDQLMVQKVAVTGDANQKDNQDKGKQIPRL